MDLKDKYTIAEIAKFSPREKEQYEESLKYYRDLKNVVDSSKEEGKIEGKIEGKTEVAREMKMDGIPIEKISRYTGLSIQEIQDL